ncbi:3-keto-5-aminohexanoate cleavage protein [Rhizorhabdus dicambivorans]|uniref:3-keto-5-aminohexanoate cleavage protein n=1 Tax=Rhizorhabdus dicambivorans TaxID=1850238 RepID=A0A2A4FWV4_9SPHN|nr:3-keto-5-aminohexanoate cleavage protein [Rhizorhabdus dicambivorans]ATE65816.1 3-keto-5-aminohexanoate cleavage protein [Rhizorhabdus dicambivorans]PCE42929.1 3-keto-5-aminohexanoate cleavage protein [Rhizorhabdus dicambivorans]
MTPLIIEIRGNEGMPRALAPNVPITPDEIVADMRACAAAGASVYHWHARDPVSNRPVDDIQSFIAVAGAIRESSDIILKPTLGFNRDSAAARMAHIDAMVAADRSYVDIVPIDNFTANADYWDNASARFKTTDAIYANTRGHVMDVIAHANALGVPFTLACPDIGAIRTGLRYRDMGLLPRAIHWELVFSGAVLPIAAAPGIAALQALVAALPPGEGWSVFCTGGDLLPLAGTIMLMGGHIAIGLGDCEQSRFGAPTNADLVGRVCQLAEIAGRPVASTAEARRMLGLGTQCR